MNLPADTAAILRAALNEAEYLRCADDHQGAYAVLAEAVSNLLLPVAAQPLTAATCPENVCGCFCSPGPGYSCERAEIMALKERP